MRIILLTIISFLIANSTSNFTISDNSNGGILLNFHNSFSIIPEYSGHKIVAESAGKMGIEGVPDMPVFSTFFKIEPGVAYQVEYEVLHSSVIQNIKLLESKDIFENEEEGLVDIPEVYNSNFIYPLQNIRLSEPMVMRGMEMVMVEFIPFSYDPIMDELTVYEDVEITIRESGFRESEIIRQLPPSEAFESLYESMVINYSREDRVEEYQQPAILYICGGGAYGAIGDPYFQDLVEWRRQRGYVVYTVHTDETGTSNNEIKNYITNAYETFDPAPEFVALVGDVGSAFNIPTFYEEWSGYSGAGDMPYSLLAGPDILPEVFIGRISVDTPDQLSVIIAKTIAFEKATYIEEIGDDWYTSAALVGDPSSAGYSAITTNQYIENVMTNWGMENIFTNYGEGNYNEWMNNALADGISYFNYSGYIGMSDFDGGMDTVTAWRTPYFTAITDGTGGFSSGWGESFIENFVRAGSISIPQGGVACVGSSTTATDPAFNSIAAMGIYEGIFSNEVKTTGASVAAGKLAILLSYPSNPNNKVSYFSHWTNLIGDPALHLWTLRPKNFNVSHPDNLPFGSNMVEVNVFDDEGNPIENARVVFLDDDDEPVYGFTNEEGQINLPVDPDYNNDLSITVVKKNYIPYKNEIHISDSGAGLNIMVNQMSINDEIGNNDNVINPGETISILFPIQNIGGDDLTNIEVSLSSDNDLVTILSGSAFVGNLLMDGTAEIEFEFSLSSSAIFMEELHLYVNIVDDIGNFWFSTIPAFVSGSKLSVNSFGALDGILIQPGESIDFDIYLSNDGDLPTGDISGTLTENSLMNYLEIDDNMGAFDPIGPGQIGFSVDGFHIFTSDDIINGSMHSLQLDITDDLGYDRSEFVMLQIGEVSVTDPIGPDSYGYYIYDSGDLGYTLVHPYSWIEIDPTLGGEGSALEIYDEGNGSPWTQTPAHLDLPFTFTFYGVDYTEITISSNGYIALGNSNMSSYRNYVLPGAGGPSPMIAAFWDDLKTNNGGGIYSYVDEVEGKVIIEWSGIRTDDQNSLESFQIILIDAITPTGDDEILIQYKEFNNTTVGNMNGYVFSHGNYCTIGIENHLGNIGLQYTFNNQYPVAAMELENETTLFITTRLPSSVLMGDINADDELNIQDVLLIVNHILGIIPLGEDELFYADLNQDDAVNIQDIILLISNILE